MTESHSTMDLEGAVKVIEAFVKRDAQSDTHEVLALGGMAATLARIQRAVDLGNAKLCAARNIRASGAARLSQEAIGIIVSSLETRRDRVVASQICSLWRTVVFDIPGFSPTLVVRARREEPSDEILSLLGDYYCNHQPGSEAVVSDIHRLGIVPGLPQHARVPLSLFCTAHCDLSTLAGDDSNSIVPDVLRTIIRQPDRDWEWMGFRSASADKLLLDVLSPLHAASNRIASINLSMKCGNWLLLFLCLPPMTALRSIVIDTDDKEKRGMDLPKPVFHLALSEQWPELPVSFPVLQKLQVSGISCSGGWDMYGKQMQLRISTRRLATLLGSMPQLHSLDLSFYLWPTIVQDDSGDLPPADAPQQIYDNPNLQRVSLESYGKYAADADCSSISQMLRILPVIPKSTMRCAVRGDMKSYKHCLDVLSYSDFVPTALRLLWERSWYFGDGALLITARDGEGHERTAVPRKTKAWTGGLLLQCLDTSHLTDLVIEDVEWDPIADGFAAPALKNLEVILNDVAPSPPPERRRINLPALRSVRFTLDKSVKRRAARFASSSAPLRIEVSVAVLRTFLAAALPAVEQRLEAVVIHGADVVMVPIAEGGDPLEELGRFAQSVRVV